MMDIGSGILKRHKHESQNSEQMKQILTILRMFGEGLTKYRGIACLTEIKKQEEVIPLKNS